MNNHYHLVIETPDGNLSKGMLQINGGYTQIFNKGRSGEYDALAIAIGYIFLSGARAYEI
jgi:hypothetical protein